MITVCYIMVYHLLRTILCFTPAARQVDGMHRRSGIAEAHLAELHGNLSIESCQAPATHAILLQLKAGETQIFSILHTSRVQKTLLRTIYAV